MTAPAVVSNAPASPESSPFDIDHAISQISTDAIAQTLAENPDVVPASDTTEVVRDEKGRFAPKEPVDGDTPTTSPTPSGERDVTVGDPDTETPVPVALPEGFVAVPKIEGREPATAFKVMDKDGELEIPDFLIEFNANGKTRKEPIDKVVRLAERGVYNEEREQAVVASRQEAQAIVQQHHQLQAYARQLEAEREQMLSSDEAYLTKRAEWDAKNTPEARAHAALQQANAMQTATLFQQARTVSNHFFEGNVLPAVNVIATHLPEVSSDEIGARLVLLTNHLRIATPDGDTMIPPAAHQAVRDIIARDIAPWAEQLHEARATDRRRTQTETQRVAAAAKAETTKAQVEAQRAKSLVGRVAKGGTGQANKESPKPKPIASVEDAMQSALDSTFESIGLSRPRGS